MSESPKLPIHLFDPDQEFAIVLRRLPHWSQAGAISFITWRTWDSIPEPVLQTWLAERDAWLRRHGIDSSAFTSSNRHAERDDYTAKGLTQRLNKLGPSLAREFRFALADRWNDHLDACHGACVLRNPELSKQVADSLLHFDGERYDLTDFVVMPNHVHLLVAFPDDDSMLKQCESWKHYTATRINRALGRKGRFWQQDGFDHLVRTPEQFHYGSPQ